MYTHISELNCICNQISGHEEQGKCINSAPWYIHVPSPQDDVSYYLQVRKTIRSEYEFADLEISTGSSVRVVVVVVD